MNLAIFGNPPAFKRKLHVGKPNLPRREVFLGNIAKALDDRWLTNDGPIVREFEIRVADILKVEHCVAVANATLGLQLLAWALPLNGEVIVPSFTFIATPHALMWENLKPVFADIDPVTHCLDPVDVLYKVSPQTTGICGVHLWGNCCNVKDLQTIADTHGLQLYYDAAHAFYCSGPDRMIGNYGEAEVFSFHATKFLHTFEGGCITTNNGDLAEHLRMMRNFGFPGDHGPVRCLGINAKLNEISAAMGLANLGALQSVVRHNWNNYLLYKQQLAGLPGVRFMEYNESYSHNYQYVVIEFANQWLTANDLKDILWAENVLARRYFTPCHLLPPYNMPEGTLPVTEEVARKTLVLPTGTTVQQEDVLGVCRIIQHVVEDARAIAGGLDANECSPFA